MGQVHATNDTNFQGRDDRQNGAWTITSDHWSTYGRIVLPINPENLEVGMRLRAAEVQMQGGKYITTSRRERNNSVYEFPTIAFKFNSGNIQPVFSEDYIGNARQYGEESSQRIPNKDNVGDHRYGKYFTSGFSTGSRVPELYDKSVPIGIQNLYALLNLVNDTWMLDKTENNRPCTVLNRIIITTSSLAFPALTFYGFIDEAGLQWSESADQFNNFDTSFNLVVTYTDPRLGVGQIENLISRYKTSMFDGRAPITQPPVHSSTNSAISSENMQADPTMADSVRTTTASGVKSLIGGVNSASDYFAKYWSNNKNKA